MTALDSGTSQAAGGDGDGRGLVLDSLEVKNFRAFRHLQVEKLGRVNLITGKNNVGKTSLLEALWLYARRASPDSIRRLLELRDEMLWGSDYAYDFTDLSAPRRVPGPARHRTSDELVLTFLPLFHGAEPEGKPPATIGPCGDANRTLTVSLESSTGALWPLASASAAIVSQARTNGMAEGGNEIYLAVRFAEHALRRDPLDRIYYTLHSDDMIADLPYKLVRSYGADPVVLKDLYANAERAQHTDDVLDALKLVVPNIESLGFVGEPRAIRGTAIYAQTIDSADHMPLSRLGEGANRMAGLALALVGSADGYLLVDEIENGFHYSVMPAVWNTLFTLARRLNVQVFATTHSWECIEAFQQAAAADDDPSSGVLIRLQNNDGDVSATVFDERRLAVVTRQGIEVR
jgi:hypothetical protein